MQERGCLSLAAAASGLAESELLLNLQDSEGQAARHEVLQTVSDVLHSIIDSRQGRLKCRGAMILRAIAASGWKRLARFTDHSSSQLPSYAANSDNHVKRKRKNACHGPVFTP